MDENSVNIDNSYRSLGEEEIEQRFGFHKATIEGPNASAPIHAHLRRNFVNFANYLDEVLPPGRTKALALTDLEKASMWAHKAIASSAPLVKE